MDNISPKIFYKSTATSDKSRASSALNPKKCPNRTLKQDSSMSNKTLRNVKHEANSSTITLRSKKLKNIKEKRKIPSQNKPKLRFSDKRKSLNKNFTSNKQLDKNNTLETEENHTVDIKKTKFAYSNLPFSDQIKSPKPLTDINQLDNYSLKIEENPTVDIEKTKLSFSDKNKSTKALTTINQLDNYSSKIEENPTVNLEKSSTKYFHSKIPIPISRSKKKFYVSKHQSVLSFLDSFKTDYCSIENINLKRSENLKMLNLSKSDGYTPSLKTTSRKSSSDSFKSVLSSPVWKSLSKNESCNEMQSKSSPNGAESLSASNSKHVKCSDFESIAHSPGINDTVESNSSSTYTKITNKGTTADAEELYFNKNESVLNSYYESIAHNSTEVSVSSENNVTITSKYGKNNSVTNGSESEYLPDSTINTTVDSETLNSNHKSIQDSENSLLVITAPLDIRKINIPCSSESKKHFCIFCKTLQTNLARHLLLKHKSEKEIKAISKLPKKHKDRINVFNRLRKDGDFLHNTNKSLNTGILIVSRQQHTKEKNKPDDYVCCKNCKGFFSKKTLRIHLNKCAKLKKNDRSNMISSRRLTQYVDEEANEILKTQIFPVLTNDKVTRSIRYDDLIIKYGNKMSEKYSLNHQHDMIRAQLRLLGRFKLAVKKFRPHVKLFKEIYKPQMYNDCIKALRKVANWDTNLMWFKTPAVAQSLTSLIKKCGYKQRTEYIKTQEDVPKKDLEDFLLLWEEEIPTLINKKALEDQANNKRVKKIVLPPKEDIKKLYIFLKNKMESEIKVLEDKFCRESWNELIKATLIFLQIFNRRRSGEIERLTIANYKNKETITDNVDKDQLKNISKESLKFAKQFVRIILRGKLGRTVSVLLSPLAVSAIDLIIKYRVAAGIPTTNEYIFCKKGCSKLSKQYFRACPLLRQFSMECGAVLPESLRGTTLRKHIATYTSLLNIEDSAVDTLANFMGHHTDIHKKCYRMSIPVAEVTCVSKLLMNAICDGDENDEVDEGDETNEELKEAFVNSVAKNVTRDNGVDFTFQEQSESDDSSESEPPSKKIRRSTSPYGKTRRSRWSEEERKIITSHFGCLKDLKKLPSLTECFKLCRKHQALKKRTPQQMKTWIDNQRRYK